MQGAAGSSIVPAPTRGLVCAALAVVGLLLLPTAASASAGLKPSEAPLVTVGQHYFGNSYHASNDAERGPVDLWRLPPLLTSDAVTIAWNASGGAPELCLAQNIDDFSWAEEANICNGSGRYRVSGGGSSRTVIEAKSATSSPFLEFWGGSCCSSEPYDFTIESIQHAIGVGLTPVTSITPTSTLTGSANLSNGSPAPDGLAFTLTASWVTPVNKASHSRSYTVASGGGALAFPLNLPSSAQGKHISLTVTRPADPQYLAASSPAMEATVAKLTPPRKHHHRRHHRRHHHRHVSARLSALASAATVQNECVQAGLAKPQVLHQPAMHHAGLRPLTPRHWHSQGTWGWFLFLPLPEGCSPGVIRAVTGQLQMQKRSNRSVWINVGAKNGNLDWKSPNEEGRAVMLGYGPDHAWPDYLFNECIGGKGWLKVRGILTLKVKDGSTHEVVGESRYTFPVTVHGSCKLARISKRETAGYKEEWGGQGSGSLRLDSSANRRDPLPDPYLSTQTSQKPEKSPN